MKARLISIIFFAFLTILPQIIFQEETFIDFILVNQHEISPLRISFDGFDK